MANRGIICLVGLPGAGKSFAVDQIQRQYVDSGFHIVVYDYDSIIGVVKNDQYNAWKYARNNISESIIKLLDESGDGKFLNNCSYCTVGSVPSYPHILILDDNFFYSSMRKEIYHICQKYGCIFGEIVFDFDINICKKRNLSRNNSLVTDHTIEEMAKLFEFPRESWEKNVLWLLGDSQPDSVLPTHIIPVSMSPDSDTSGIILNFLFNFIKLEPEEHPAVNEELKAKDREKMQADLKHQSDVCLRKIVSKRIKSDREKGIHLPYVIYANCKNMAVGRLLDYENIDSFIIDGFVDKNLLYSHLLRIFSGDILKLS